MVDSLGSSESTQKAEVPTFSPAKAKAYTVSQWHFSTRCRLTPRPPPLDVVAGRTEVIFLLDMSPQNWAEVHKETEIMALRAPQEGEHEVQGGSGNLR